MQEERSIANGTPKRESSGPVACGENEDSSRARGELRRRGRRSRSPSGNIDLRGFEDPDENFVQLVNSVPNPNPNLTGRWRRRRSFLEYGVMEQWAGRL